MTCADIEGLPAASRRLLDYVAVLGPEGVPRVWVKELAARDKGIPAQGGVLRLARNADPVDELVEAGVLQEGEAGLVADSGIVAEVRASIEGRPAYRSTLWNAITVLALTRGKMLQRGRVNAHERQEASRCMRLVEQLAQEGRKLAALDLAAQICGPLCTAGKQAEAIALLESLLKETEEADFTRRHILALNQLAEAYMRERDSAKAVAIRKKAVDLSTRLNGAQHRATAFCHAGLAQALAAANQPKEAMTAAWQAMVLYRQHLPEEHYQMAYPLEALAVARMAGGKTEEARAAMEQAIALRKSSERAGKYPLAMDQLFVAATYVKMRKWVEAEPWAEEAMAARLEQLDADSPGMESYYGMAANIARGLKQHEKDKALTEKVLALREKRLPPGDPLVLQSKVVLSSALMQLKREEEALVICEACIPLLEQRTEAPQRLALKLMYARAMAIHRKYQRHSQAFSYVRRNVALMEQETVSGRPRITTYLAAISLAQRADEFGFAREMLAKARAVAESTEQALEDELPKLLELKEQDITASEQVAAIWEGRRKAWEAFTEARKSKGLTVPMGEILRVEGPEIPGTDGGEKTVPISPPDESKFLAP